MEAPSLLNRTLRTKMYEIINQSTLTSCNSISHDYIATSALLFIFLTLDGAVTNRKCPWNNACEKQRDSEYDWQIQGRHKGQYKSLEYVIEWSNWCCCHGGNLQLWKGKFSTPPLFWALQTIKVLFAVSVSLEYPIWGACLETHFSLRKNRNAPDKREIPVPVLYFPGIEYRENNKTYENWYFRCSFSFFLKFLTCPSNLPLLIYLNYMKGITPLWFFLLKFWPNQQVHPRVIATLRARNLSC